LILPPASDNEKFMQKKKEKKFIGSPPLA